MMQTSTYTRIKITHRLSSVLDCALSLVMSLPREEALEPREPSDDVSPQHPCLGGLESQVILIVQASSRWRLSHLHLVCRPTLHGKRQQASWGGGVGDEGRRSQWLLSVSQSLLPRSCVFYLSFFLTCQLSTVRVCRHQDLLSSLGRQGDQGWRAQYVLYRHTRSRGRTEQRTARYVPQDSCVPRLCTAT